MKKTLAAVAVLGAFAGSALAADVTLYGLVDLGFGYSNVDKNGTKDDSWGMKSGQDSGSRIGFKGTEQISDGLTVGFQLETQFDADTGVNKPAFFHRISRLYVQTDFGEIGMGRYGMLDSTTGPYSLAGSAMHATTGVAGAGSTAVVFLGQDDRRDNAITYKSPKFGGFQVQAQFAGESTDEYSSDSERYYALGATYDVGAFHSALVVSSHDYAAGSKYGTKELDDGLVVTGGVTYDFGVTKAFVAGQYFDNMEYDSLDAAVTVANDIGYVKGYGATIGAKTPVLGGVLTTQVGYGDAEDIENADKTYKAWNVAALYHYGLSKRTTVYGAVGYQNQKEEYAVGDYEVKTTTFGVGMIHNF